MRMSLIAFGAAALVAGLAAPAVADPGPAGAGRATLTGFASLPAETFVPGSEPSGARLGTEPINGLTPPFAAQPVQGFSGIVPAGRGRYHMLSDNGFGAKGNNFPFSASRTPGKPDNNEFITVRLARPLHADPRATP